NIQKFHKDLEDEIQQEQHLIKLLQDTLNLHITSEQTLSKEVEKRGKVVEQKSNDLRALNQEIQKIDQEIKALEAQLQEKQKQQHELERAIKAAQEASATLEQSLHPAPVDQVQNPSAEEGTKQTETPPVQGEAGAPEKPVEESTAPEGKG
ncbi:MAG: hypothetical protein KJ645_12545, partial [Planctomycetes bacterium]|nr:hypothetical protein [Planctomycetota bacterium]